MERMLIFVAFAKRRIFFNGNQLLADGDVRLYLRCAFSVEKVLPVPGNLLVAGIYPVAALAVVSGHGMTFIHIVVSTADDVLKFAVVQSGDVVFS